MSKFTVGRPQPLYLYQVFGMFTKSTITSTTTSSSTVVLVKIKKLTLYFNLYYL